MILLILLLGYLMITTGVVWLFGPVGLIACGVVLLAITIFTDLEVFSDE